MTHSYHQRALELLWFGLLILVVSGSPAFAGDLSDPYDKTLLYRHADSPEDNEIQIAPIRRLAEQLADSSGMVADPLPEEKLSALVSFVNVAAERRKTHRKACNTSPVDWGRYTTPTDPKDPNAMDLRNVASQRSLVVLAEIEHITEAWDFHYETPVAIVFVRVEEILFDESETLSTGDVVSYLRLWGEATILGVDFCTRPPAHVPSEATRVIGDRLIVTGEVDSRNPDHLSTYHLDLYSVEDNLVYPPLGDTDPPGYSDRVATLDELRELFR